MPQIRTLAGGRYSNKDMVLKCDNGDDCFSDEFEEDEETMFLVKARSRKRIRNLDSVMATVGACNIPEPNSWKVVEHTKWKSWSGLGNTSPTEAMRLFVKILEEDDPSWYSRASNFVAEPVVDVQMNHNSKVEPVVENGNSFPETKTISTENGSLTETQDKDIVVEGLGSVAMYDQWIAPPISGQRPKARYEIFMNLFLAFSSIL
ncbi:acyl-CoA-binding domain-containing protein 4-like [Quercus robur]|uniref:acyl-CoA-binding domain-containing protein 4-like n=1 Tax=Quercus robur TaxID=38942 RepID=UPI002162801A|nr:acyl-CoA-binding domain-containing protein 4-like [Quercus robur]